VVVCKKLRLQRKREKKVACLACTGSGSISLSTNTEDMTSTASSGMGPKASIGGPFSPSDAEASSNVRNEGKQWIPSRAIMPTGCREGRTNTTGARR
jgi:hypothetical protein